jgi:excisionase family DNA binding protein
VEDEHDLMTVSEVAQALRVHKQTVYRMIREGCFTVIALGKGFRITRASYEAWRAANTQEAR